ncbi:LIC10906 family membrane protein [Leptospira santarosai]|uniref:LIC10906 family membrane protein n=2 Tax=Leptospira santarosai TaxID=28183 RepID=UPI0024AFCB6D|nr:histidine kinase N-terminal 7TM domain-containing protein [Leptospira santarosai]MDI7175139.1 histidine kinase N-terminal 7TM domain-containing protein [Leptospira santarosai]MDI7194976.1 histidine kinase N-terminal 7TM domain-containing protein [Leptospira santarosai]MDO6399192.1 histidine kinase N-terminal 7TM domain-containing protein [Leptospira santarosai]MDO6404817.1 histidine kinase N-terminal 7TM domain-containing protein [Leptospira santarosai]
MNYTIIYNITIGFFLLFLGWYVYRIPCQRTVQKYFFWLCVSIATWRLCFGFRFLVPFEFREIVLNWMLIPILFSPYLFYSLVKSLFGNKNTPSRWTFFINSVIFCYLIFTAATGLVAKIQDHSTFTYQPTYNYHLIIAYCVIYISFSFTILVKIAFQSRGDLRVRAFLLSSGTFIAFTVTILCVYILPFYGHFYSSEAVLGLLPSSILWAVAILHYDAFEIREKILEGKHLPMLNRIFSFPVLGLYNLLDSPEYGFKLLNSKSMLTLDILIEDHKLRKSTNLDIEDISGILANRYKKRIR